MIKHWTNWTVEEAIRAENELMIDKCAALAAENELLRRVAEAAEDVEHDSWCGHGGTGNCDCNRAVLSLVLVDWRTSQAKGTKVEY